MTLKNTDAEPVAQHDSNSTPSTTPTETPSEVVSYGDAVVLRPYNEDDYSKEITITVGAHTASKSWKPIKQPLGAFLAKLCQHKVGEKDGPAFVLGDMAPGQRLKVAVKTLECIGLDDDTGTPSAEWDASLSRFGFTAIRYSTHSHLKSRTEFKKDKLKKFAKDANLDGYDIDDELIRRFLREDQRWHSSIVETAIYAGEDHTEKGIVVYVEHCPMPKHRIVVPLAEPFEIAKEGDTQKEAMDKWAKVPEALANMLGLPFDRSCIDPSRLFYFPRHGKNKPFEISLWGGPLFDYHSLTLSNPLDDIAAEANKGGGKSVTPEGRELGRWSITHAPGFQIVDVLEAHASDRIRGSASSNGKTIECPFDEDHSNPGDTDDTGCFAVNAGYSGHTELFTISCRHETCRNKTMLDHLGKMLKDGWFDKSVLTDDNFNAIIEETPDKPKSEAAKKIEREDDARAKYETLIDALTIDSSEEKIEAAMADLMAANLSTLKKNRAIATMAKKLKTTSKMIKDALADFERRRKSTTEKPGAAYDKKNQKMLFRYNGSYNADDAADAVVRAFLAKNKHDKRPTHCHIGGNAARLSIEDGRAKFKLLSNRGTWSEGNNLIAFVKSTDEGDGARDFVPDAVANHVHEQACVLLPAAPQVVYVPCYSQDERLIETPGFHQEINTLLITEGLDIPPVPQNPTFEQAQEALKWIREELLSDFKFSGTDLKGNPSGKPSEANALAMLITPFMRRMIPGRTPLFLLDKPDSGAGATLLAWLSMWLSDGAQAPYIKYSKNPEEMEKKIVAFIKGAQRHIIFDNVRQLTDDTLLICITSDMVGGRDLGKTLLIMVENLFQWIATGINPTLSEEMERRTVRIRLDAPTKPLHEREYRHPDISGLKYEEFVKKNRGLAVCHILTLIEYWLDNGAVEFSDRKLPGFDDWAKKVGGVLQACGVTDFLNNKRPIVANTDGAEVNEYLRWFLKEYGAGRSFPEKDIFERVIDNLPHVLDGKDRDERHVCHRDLVSVCEGRKIKHDGKLYEFNASMDKNETVLFGMTERENEEAE